MNTNALIATIKSILHTSKGYSREYADITARNLADTLAANWDNATKHYGTTDQYELAELVTKDFVKISCK